MIQVFHNANFRLMWGTKWWFMAFSAAAIAAAFLLMFERGFNYGIDFSGGTAVQVKFRERPQVEKLRAALESANLGDINIQRIGNIEDNEVLIRVEQKLIGGNATDGEGGDVSSKVLEALREGLGQVEDSGGIDLNAASELSLKDWLEQHLPAPAADAGAIAAAVIRHRNQIGGVFHDMSRVGEAPGVTGEAARLLEDQATLGPFALRSVEFVGPTAGRELLHKTWQAIGAAVLFILLYVWVRFHRVSWGLAAIVALVHDVSIAAGAMALTGKEVSLPVVAALLTILGYSINDTIVVFDRIRENLRLHRDIDFEEVVNGSINQTLSRTVLTSFTAFVAVTALYMYGGDKLDPLSFCLMVGIIFGSYSSIFVASALLVVIQRTLGSKYVKA